MFGRTTFSQIGGVPGWVQYPAFPSCTGCSRTMICVAQIANNDLGEEGTHYAFWCRGCGVTATAYQQT